MGGTRQVGMRPIPKSLYNFTGDKATDDASFKANLEQSRAMYEQGGMLMDEAEPAPRETWRVTPGRTAKAIFDQYRTKDKEGRYVPPGRDAIGSGRDLNRNNSFGWASAFS